MKLTVHRVGGKGSLSDRWKTSMKTTYSIPQRMGKDILSSKTRSTFNTEMTEGKTPDFLFQKHVLYRPVQSFVSRITLYT